MELSTALIYYAAIVLIIYIILVWCRTSWLGAIVVSLAIGWIFLITLFPPNRMMAFTGSNTGAAYAFILVFTLIIVFFYSIYSGLSSRVENNCLTWLVDKYCRRNACNDVAVSI
jgi:hypothetical protein